MYYTRCVRGEISQKNLIDNGDDTVSDENSGLTWQKTEGELNSWGGAIEYCENLTLGGKNDWRLPNIKELEAIVDYSKMAPKIDTVPG